MHPITITLNDIEALDEAETEGLEAMLCRAKKIQLKKSDCLWGPGAMPDYEGYVVSGLLRHVVEEKEDHERIIQFYREGDFIHDCSGAPTDYSIMAVEDSTLHILKMGSWQELMTRFPKIERISGQIMTTQLLRHKQHVNMLMKPGPEERYKFLLQTEPELVNRVSVTHLAQYLGISRETLSRMRAKVAEGSIL